MYMFTSDLAYKENYKLFRKWLEHLITVRQKIEYPILSKHVITFYVRANKCGKHIYMSKLLLSDKKYKTMYTHRATLK